MRKMPYIFSLRKIVVQFQGVLTAPWIASRLAPRLRYHDARDVLALRSAPPIVDRADGGAPIALAESALRAMLAQCAALPAPHVTQGELVGQGMADVADLADKARWDRARTLTSAAWRADAELAQALAGIPALAEIADTVATARQALNVYHAVLASMGYVAKPDPAPRGAPPTDTPMIRKIMGNFACAQAIRDLALAAQGVDKSEAAFASMSDRLASKAQDKARQAHMSFDRDTFCATLAAPSVDKAIAHFFACKVRAQGEIDRVLHMRAPVPAGRDMGAYNGVAGANMPLGAPLSAWDRGARDATAPGSVARLVANLQKVQPLHGVPFQGVREDRSK